MSIARRLTREDFDDMRERLATRASCLNPSCTHQVPHRTGTQGRQRMFCSSKCRLTYGRRRRLLLELLATLEWNADYLDRPIATAELNQLNRHVRWELARYGGVDEDAIDQLLPRAPTTPGAVSIHNLTQLEGGATASAEIEAAAEANHTALRQFYDGRKRPSRR